ncbi:MAG: hypothetical protein MK052_04470 [Alphaproteobacteria bacterium]|nr:hypothetical protein [Alphaproteobacteria bacterium]
MACESKGAFAAWQKTTQQQLKELAQLRRILSTESLRLKNILNKNCAASGLLEKGAREQAVAEVIRIAQAYLKLISQEQSLYGEILKQLEHANSKKADSQLLSETEWQMLETAIDKRRKEERSLTNAAQQDEGDN